VAELRFIVSEPAARHERLENGRIGVVKPYSVLETEEFARVRIVPAVLIYKEKLRMYGRKLTVVIKSLILVYDVEFSRFHIEKCGKAVGRKHRVNEHIFSVCRKGKVRSEADYPLVIDVFRIHDCKFFYVSICVYRAYLTDTLTSDEIDLVSLGRNEGSCVPEDGFLKYSDERSARVKAYNPEAAVAKRRIEAVRPQIFLICRERLIREIKALNKFCGLFGEYVAFNARFFVNIFFKKGEFFKFDHGDLLLLSKIIL
jgi:hypothetical protein